MEEIRAGAPNITNQRNCFGIGFYSCVHTDCDVWVKLIANDSTVHLAFKNCTLMPTSASTSAWFIENAGTGGHGDPYGFMVHGCLFVCGSSWNSTYFRETTSTAGFFTAAYGASIRNNVYNKAASTNWRNANTNLSLANWNALDAVSGEAAESTLTQADVVAASDWLPGSGFTTARGNGVPEDGVVWDHRGIRRDPDAATWVVGATGTEARPATPTFTVTPGDTQNTLTLGAIGSLTRRMVFRSTTMGGPHNYIGAQTSGTTYTDTGLSNGTTYYYTVIDVNALYNLSEESSEVSGTPTSVSWYFINTATGSLALQTGAA
jgi:hypothetical protein